jgi:hypothetical protein
MNELCKLLWYKVGKKVRKAFWLGWKPAKACVLQVIRMVESQVEFLENGRCRKVSLWQDGRQLLYAEVMARWQDDEAFRDAFISILADAPYPAYFWETPPVTLETIKRPFAFVQMESSQLAKVRPNRNAFRSYFEAERNNEEVVAFSNLGKDAYLIVPCPQSAQETYTHIGAFTAKAPMSQQHVLWQAVGKALAQRLNQQPIWVSTSGLGVYWLHIRLDTYPKYYTYTPYRQNF